MTFPIVWIYNLFLSNKKKKKKKKKHQISGGVEPVAPGGPSLDQVCDDVLDGWLATARAQVNLPIACLLEGLKSISK